MQMVEYLDQEGISRRVWIPDNAPTSFPLSEGIPCSYPVDYLFLDCSLNFRKRLVVECFARNLITQGDFANPSHIALIRSALLGAIQADVFTIVEAVVKHVK